LGRVAIAIALLALSSAAVAQAPDAKQPPAGAKQAKVPPAPSPGFVVPPPEELLTLIRATLLELSNAVHTGNFTVLHALGSPSFQAANSPQRLGIALADLGNPNIRLSRIAIVAPVMSETPSITPENRLRLVGSFASDPLLIKFQLLYEQINGDWRLFAMSINPALPSTPLTAAPPS
jgi:hypothetical protein